VTLLSYDHHSSIILQILHLVKILQILLVLLFIWLDPSYTWQKYYPVGLLKSNSCTYSRPEPTGVVDLEADRVVFPRTTHLVNIVAWNNSIAYHHFVCTTNWYIYCVTNRFYIYYIDSIIHIFLKQNIITTVVYNY